MTLYCSGRGAQLTLKLNTDLGLRAASHLTPRDSERSQGVGVALDTTPVEEGEVRGERTNFLRAGVVLDTSPVEEGEV